MKRLHLAILIGILLLLTACKDTKASFILNPDGSGKLIYYDTLFGMADFLEGLEGEELQRNIDDNVRTNILGNFVGVDAWKDVSYSLNEAGDLVFEGTVYFKDVNELSLPEGTLGIYQKGYLFKPQMVKPH